MKQTFAVMVFGTCIVAFIVGASFGAWNIKLEARAPFRAGRITVTTTATGLYTAPPRGGDVRLCNRHTTPIFIGGSDLTTANGFEILNATCETFRPYPGDVIWFIVAAATARVDWAEGNYPR